MPEPRSNRKSSKFKSIPSLYLGNVCVHPRRSGWSRFHPKYLPTVHNRGNNYSWTANQNLEQGCAWELFYLVKWMRWWVDVTNRGSTVPNKPKTTQGNHLCKYHLVKGNFGSLRGIFKYTSLGFDHVTVATHVADNILKSWVRQSPTSSMLLCKERHFPIVNI